MKRLSNPLRLAFALLVISLLVACAPGQPTPDPAEIEAAIQTSVAQTVEAQGEIATSVAMTVAAKEAEDAASQPTATSVPPTAVPTLTPVLPSATPFPTNTSSSGGGGSSSGGGGTGTYEYSCDPDIQKRPFDNTEFKPGDHFDVKFTIKNTGTSAWEAGKDLVLLGNAGNTLVAPPGTIQLPRMEPGDLFAVGPFDAIAPADSGHYVVDFKLEGGFCYPYVAFNVR